MNCQDSHAAPSELEVEKKFPVSENPDEFNNLKQTLTSLGFQMTHQEEFVDWYFDLPAPNWYFSLNDIWIRYREKKWKMNKSYGWRGAWQLKRGADTDAKETDGMTTYQEYQGAAAKEMILDLLCNIDEESCNLVHGESEILPSSEYNDVPHLDGAEQLVPFSRFKTFRSCWHVPESNDVSGNFKGLKVDIDRTDIGYSVGEVEAVVKSDSNEEEIQFQKDQIRRLVDLLTSDMVESTSAVSTGKLEFYLQRNCKDHYNACVKAGVI